MLFKCTDCGHDVNVEAKSCPNCGAIKPFKNQILSQDQVKPLSFKEKVNFKKLGGKIQIGKWQKIVWAGVALLLIVLIFSPQKEKTPEEIAAEVEQKIESEAVKKDTALQSECRYAIKQSLNDPDSVEFDAVVVMAKKDGTYLVIQDLRAKNAFGALIKGSFQCIASYSDGSATLIDIKETGQE